MQIKNRIALVTGAASGIGSAVAEELSWRGASMIALVDMSETVCEVADEIEHRHRDTKLKCFLGDVTDSEFCKEVYDSVCANYGVVNICVPAAGITRDSPAVKINRATGEAEIYPMEHFRQVAEVDLIAPIYWSLEMVARIAQWRYGQGLERWMPEEGISGVVIFIGSISSQGHKGQLSYATAKSGLEGAAATLMKEAIYYGVRCGVIHPGFTDTPTVRALGEEYIQKHILPETQLGRLIRPDEIADAICFMISNSAVSGELWADAGWHPAPA
ncbi:MAG TPA: SDR family NAD(P)-dependent oxidoreductase [Bryobacteraceae bacterium]|nr:SDR family NAD(P)-dependent oxidoreductase [Bryobacteraceae bacterium]